MIDTELSRKVALVTGGNNPHGIGAAVAGALAEQGAAVFIHYFRQSSDVGESEPETPGLDYYYAMQSKTADDLVRKIRERGGRADSWEADLADPGVVPELMDRAEQALGPVEVLVNNAADYYADTFLPQRLLEQEGGGVWEEGPTTTTVTTTSFDRHFAVNTRAAVLLTAEFARRHAEQSRSWGRIINISADCSEGSPAEISYRASKYALESYSRAAAAELGPLGITVNIISPGPIQTGYISNQVEQALIPSIPLRRVGQPEDVADAVVFLASKQAGWITGQLLRVHGGHRMAMGL